MPADLLAHAWIGRRMLAGSRTFATVNPATGELLGRVAESGAEQTQAAIEAARRCFDRTAWAQSPRLRQDSLLAWAAGLEAAAEDAARWLTLTNGKPLAAARGEIAAAVSEIRYYAGLARHNPGHAMEVAPGEVSVMLREPAGVAGIIVPWNAPAVLLIRSLAPAIAAGCTSVVKPAPRPPPSPSTACARCSSYRNFPREPSRFCRKAVMRWLRRWSKVQMSTSSPSPDRTRSARPSWLLPRRR